MSRDGLESKLRSLQRERVLSAPYGMTAGMSRPVPRFYDDDDERDEGTES
jgi:hypothetical protein